MSIVRLNSLEGDQIDFLIKIHFKKVFKIKVFKLAKDNEKHVD